MLRFANNQTRQTPVNGEILRADVQRVALKVFHTDEAQ